MMKPTALSRRIVRGGRRVLGGTLLAGLRLAPKHADDVAIAARRLPASVLSMAAAALIVAGAVASSAGALTTWVTSGPQPTVTTGGEPLVTSGGQPMVTTGGQPMAWPPTAQ
jgi:hypothetical protein